MAIAHILTLATIYNAIIKDMEFSKNMNLAEFSTQTLAQELIARNDFFEEGGLILKPEFYKLFTEMGVIFCVDGIAIRKSSAGIEAMAIRRNTGAYQGKLCSVGGRVHIEEDIEAALRRHFRVDVGHEIELTTPWDKPAGFFQFMRPRADGTVAENFGTEPSRRHAVSVLYLVRLDDGAPVFGSTAHGGQEASGVEWFTLENMPHEEEFGYGQGVYFRKCLELANETF